MGRLLNRLSLAAATAGIVAVTAFAPTAAYATQSTVIAPDLGVPDNVLAEGTSTLSDAVNVYCGENATWAYANGTLTISGTGAIQNFQPEQTPWYAQYHTAITNVVIAPGITSIGDFTFSNCTNIQSVSIPNTVTSIGGYAFSGCTKLTSIELPNALTTIGTYAFNGCTSVTSFTIPSTVTTIGNYAFQGCTSIQSFAVNNNPNFSTDGRSLVNRNGALFAYANASGSTYVVPSTVRTIQGYAFAYCNKLERVYFPSSLTTIGTFAFIGCTGLTTLDIPDSVTTIGSYAFQYCVKLKTVSLPHKLKTISDGTFGYCTGLQSITIPASVTRINRLAFSNCSLIGNGASRTFIATFEGNMPTINDNAFQLSRLVAMYPADNTTYTESTMKQYGGDIAWIPDTVDGAHSHSWGAWTVVKTATCEEDGREERACVCGMKDARPISALGHAWNNGTVTQTPSCTSEGTLTFTCTRDANHTYTMPIDATGHAWDNGLVTTEPTCEASGVMTYRCTNNRNHRYTSVIDPVGHAWDSGVVTTDPTCEDNGVKTYTCQNDSAHTYTMPVAPIGHAWDEGTVTTAPTCEDEGLMTYTCQNDATHTYTMPIDPTGHEWDEGVLEPTETCLVDGIMTYTCKHNPNHTYAEVVSALGGNHQWGEWVILVQPTGTTDGLQHRECTRCGEEQDQAINALTGINGFVYRLYANVLGRTPDAEGLAVQVNGIKAMGAAQITYNFFNSDEYRTLAETMTNEEQIELAYQTLLGRGTDEDPEGLAFWTEYLNNGMSINAVVAGFAESGEFRDLCAEWGVNPGNASAIRSQLEPRDQNPGVTRFAARMYTQVLLRESIDTEGLNAQCDALLKGTPAWQIAVNFFTSREFMYAGHSNEEVVAIAYNALLGRPGSAPEIENWAKQYDTLGTVGLVRGFCQSNEFEAICKSCGMTSGMR